MGKNITINFGNIVEEMKEKELRLCLVNDNKGWFVVDKYNNLYQMELYRHGSYLDNLIKNRITVEFDLVDGSKSQNIKECEKEIWNTERVESFIKKHSKYWQ